MTLSGYLGAEIGRRGDVIMVYGTFLLLPVFFFNRERGRERE